jgi:hypothetical protein
MHLNARSSQIVSDFVSPLSRIALSELKTLTLVYTLYYWDCHSESDRERRILDLRKFFHPLLSTSLQQSSNLQVIDMHLIIDIALKVRDTEIENELGLIVDSAWPTTFSLVMEQIKSLKISVNCTYSVTIVNQHKNVPLVGAEKRLEIEKQLKEVHPSLMDSLAIEWRDDVHYVGHPFQHIIV